MEYKQILKQWETEQINRSEFVNQVLELIYNLAPFMKEYDFQYEGEIAKIGYPLDEQGKIIKELCWVFKKGYSTKTIRESDILATITNLQEKQKNEI